MSENVNFSAIFESGNICLNKRVVQLATCGGIPWASMWCKYINSASLAFSSQLFCSRCLASCCAKAWKIFPVPAWAPFALWCFAGELCLARAFSPSLMQTLDLHRRHVTLKVSFLTIQSLISPHWDLGSSKDHRNNARPFSLADMRFEKWRQ